MEHITSNYEHVINMLSIKRGKLMKKIITLYRLYKMQETKYLSYKNKMKTIKCKNIVKQMQNRELQSANYNIYWNCKRDIYKCEQLMDETFLKQQNARDLYSFNNEQLRRCKRTLTLIQSITEALQSFGAVIR